MVQAEADYVVVGAGSAGCVMASRLSEDPGVHVVLLEAGGDDRPLHELGQWRSNLNIHIPAGFTSMLNDPKLNWRYKTQPNPSTGARIYDMPRGKVLGGSSSINGLYYVRGLTQDYDHWAQLGASGWAWKDVEPFFQKAENQIDGDPETAGIGGPLTICETPLKHPMSDMLRDAFMQAGAPTMRDVNGLEAEGVGFGRLNQKRGLRQSTAVDYLHPALKRANLRLEKRALATRILFEGLRAVGVEFERAGERHVVRARREVILSGGTINSPQLLELSGVGQPDLLRALDIAVVAENAGVGENFQDHYACAVTARLRPGSPSMNSLSRGIGLFGQMLQFAMTRTGLLTIGGAHLTAFLRSTPEADLPDLQFHCSPATFDIATRAKTGRLVMEKQPGVTIATQVMRPHSMGNIHIGSPDPREHPAIIPNYLAEAADQRGTVAGLRWARRVLDQPALARCFGHELAPGQAANSDEELLAYARAAGSTAHHLTGTCGIGPVVDERLRVKGVEGVRVADASVMPRVTSGNTHAAAVMIGEKGADMIRFDARA